METSPGPRLKERPRPAVSAAATPLPSRSEASGAKAIDRIVCFSDAVFAIALTLLVVRIEVPPETDFSRVLAQEWPRFLSYVISFAAVGLYWVGHHRAYRHIRSWDEGLIALNLALLLCIAFVPFPAALIGERGGHQAALVLYAGTLGMAGLLSTLVWAYATYGRRLVAADLDRRLVRHHLLRAATVPLVFFLSIPLSVVSMTAAYYSWLLIVVLQLALRLLYRIPARR